MPNKPRHPELHLRGKLLAYNLSPKGRIEGALVETSSGLAQLNIPKHSAELVRGMALGSELDLPVKLEHHGDDHPVYAPDDHAQSHVSGTIARLYYALHGEINGCQLDDGTFIHLGPDNAKSCKLRVGDKVTASGVLHTGPDAVVVDAKTVSKQAAVARA